MSLEKETSELINNFLIPNNNKKILCWCNPNKFQETIGYCNLLMKIISKVIEVRTNVNLTENEVIFGIDNDYDIFKEPLIPKPDNKQDDKQFQLNIYDMGER